MKIESLVDAFARKASLEPSLPERCSNARALATPILVPAACPLVAVAVSRSSTSLYGSVTSPVINGERSGEL